jgi:hypothetical protein
MGCSQTLTDIKTNTTYVESAEQLQTTTSSTATSLANQAVETVTITPPVGYIGTISTIYVSVASNGSSGTHNVQVYAGTPGATVTYTTPADIRIIKAAAAYNKNLLLTGSICGNSDTTLENGTSPDFSGALKNFRFNNTYPLNITYVNITGAATTNARNITVRWLKQKEGSY